MKYIITLLIFLLLFGCDTQDKQNQQANNNVQAVEVSQETTSPFLILALGDSLTEGLGVKKDLSYPAVLQNQLMEAGFKVKVVNSGLSGETSSGLKSRLDWVLQLNPDLTILNIGANDAMRGLPLELTQRNIEEIINRIKQSGSEVVLAGMQIYDNLGQEYVAGFKDIYPQLANQYDVEMIPFFLEHVAGKQQYNQTDMIHPTAEGYQIIVDKNVMPVVLPVVRELINDN